MKNNKKYYIKTKKRRNCWTFKSNYNNFVIKLDLPSISMIKGL